MRQFLSVIYFQLCGEMETRSINTIPLRSPSKTSTNLSPALKAMLTLWALCGLSCPDLSVGCVVWTLCSYKGESFIFRCGI